MFPKPAHAARLLAAFLAAATAAHAEEAVPVSAGAVLAPPHARIKVALPPPIRLAPPGNPVPAGAPAEIAGEPAAVKAEADPGKGDETTGTEEGGKGGNGAQILAVFAGRPITDADVMRELWLRHGRETLDWMIGRAVIQNELARHNLSVSPDEIEKRLAEHVAGLRFAFPNLSEPEALTRAASGMRLDEYRERSVWMELALRKIAMKTLKPDERQLRKFYAGREAEFVVPERVRISQVFIAPSGDPLNDGMPGRADWEVAEQKTLEAHNRLRLGGNFAEVATAYGSGGGFSRWVGRGELIRELEDAAFSMRPGSFSTPIRSSLGFHILKTEERIERRQPDYEEVREKVLAEYEDEFFRLHGGEYLMMLLDEAQRAGMLKLGDAVAGGEGKGGVAQAVPGQ
jgi:hypothetical protein